MNTRYIFALLLFISSSAQAGLFDSIGNSLGLNRYVSPGDLRSGGQSCSSQLAPFQNAPRRTYGWLSKGGAEQDSYIQSLTTDPTCARPVAAQIARLIQRNGRRNRERNDDKHQTIQARLDALTAALGTQVTEDNGLPSGGCVQLVVETPRVTGLLGNVVEAAGVSRECAPVTTDRVKVVDQVQNRVGNFYGIRRNSTGYDILLNLNFGVRAGHTTTVNGEQMRGLSCGSKTISS